MRQIKTRSPFRHKPITLACAATWAGVLASLTSFTSNAAFAQAAAPVLAQAGTLPTITVTATRTENKVEDVPVTVTVIPALRIERELATDIKDLIRYEPGVSVRSNPSRYQAAGAATGRAGNEGINIRGLEGNQVLLQVDGIRLPAAFSFGAQSAGRGDYLDLEALKSVEILRGPSSSLYGSDGLAGAVSFVTKDPADLLTLGKPWQVSAKLAYSGADKSWMLTPSFAARGEMLEGMVLLSTRRGHETISLGNNESNNFTRTKPNPQDAKANSFLGKLVLKVNPEHQFKLSVDTTDKDLNTNVVSARFRPLSDNTTVVPTLAATTVLDLRSVDNIRRERGTLDYLYKNAKNGWLQRGEVKAYTQRSRNDQSAFEDRNTAADRVRINRYRESLSGLQANAESNFGDTVTHRLVYGFDASNTNITGLRDGTVATPPDVFPTKAFPDTKYRLAGAFVQDEIGIGQVSIIPALRYDSFKLTPKTGDPQYVGLAPAALSDSAVSPKLGVLWKAYPLAQPYANFARGFRAPTPNDVNNGFTNIAGGYRTISNPNLKPETSNTLELGLRGVGAEVSYGVALFQGQYKNFISNQLISGVAGNLANPGVFQSVNLASVKIRGLELRGQWKFAKSWNVKGTYATARGDQRTPTTSLPLDTIDPAKLVVGLGYDNSSFGGAVNWTHVARKDRAPAAANYVPGSFDVVDFTAFWNISKNVTLNAGIFNLFNKKYFHWSDVKLLPSNYAHLDAYSQPGRNASISVKAQF